MWLTELFFLKDKFPSIRNLSVWVSSLDFTSTTQFNVSFNNVSLLKSTWKINGLDLSVFNANLAKTEIYLSLGQYAMKKKSCPSEDEGNEHEKTISLANESVNCCRIN